MRTYRTMWKVTTGLLVVLGCGMALILLPPAVDAVLFVMTVLVVGCLRFSVDVGTSAGSDAVDAAGGSVAARSTGAAIRATIPLASGLGLAVVSLAGYSASAGFGTLALVAVVAATSPPVAARVLFSAGDQADSPAPVDPPRGRTTASPEDGYPVPNLDVARCTDRIARDEPAVDALGDSELCRQWRHSYVTLQRANTVAARLRIVARRQTYLDELERRAPQQLDAWLHAGARAAGDPSKFICYNDQAGENRKQTKAGGTEHP